jgi:hypothetical protein
MFRRDLSLALAAALTVAACGGESSGGAAIEVAGEPSALDGVARVYLTLDRLDAYVVDGTLRPQVASQVGARTNPTDKEAAQPEERGANVPDGWRPVRLPVDHTIDLMGVRDAKSLGELDVGSGKITQLRVVLDEQGDNRVVLKDGHSCVLDLSRIPSLGVNVSHPQLPAEFDDRHRVRLTVDFRLDEALTRGDPCSFALAPSMEIKAIDKLGDEPETEAKP